MEKQSVEEMRAEPGRKLPPVRRSQEERRRSTKLAVLRAVLDLLVDEGYLKLTVADVAERAQVSRGALSHYFRTKQDLVVAADTAWLKTMIRAGCDAEQAEALIKLTNYLMRGMVLTANWTSDTRERDQVLKVWRRQAFDLIGV